PAAALVFYRTLGSVLYREDYPLRNMKDKSDKQSEFQHMHDPVCTEKMSDLIKGCAVIGNKDAGIGRTVDKQKENKKNTGECHHQLFTDSGSKVVSPLHIK